LQETRKATNGLVQKQECMHGGPKGGERVGGGVWGVGGEGPYKSIPAGKKADLSICDLFTI